MRKGSSVPTLNPLNANFFITHWTSTPNPAAGAEAIISRPGASHVQLNHLTFTLVTDANVSNRLVWISLETSGIVIPLGSAQTAEPATGTWRHICTQNPVLNMAGNLYFKTISLPDIRSIDTADTFTVNVEGIQATDQISVIYAHWKMWRGLS
jgi:hypothetical protein